MTCKCKIESRWRYLVAGKDRQGQMVTKIYCATTDAKDSAITETRQREGIGSVEVSILD